MLTVIEGGRVSASLHQRLGDEQEKGSPAAARNLRKQLRRLFHYGVKIRMRPDNPVDLTVPIKGMVRKHGIHAWTELDIEKYRSRWSLGTRQRLALELILWTDQRKGDAIALGPKNMEVLDGDYFLRLEQEKTGKCMRVKVSSFLREAIDAMAVTGTETFLLNGYGKPFTPAGFGMRFRDWCDAADLKHCSAHGLRKAGARRAADVGATQQQLTALGGWTNDKEVATYVESANQSRMNAQAIDAVTEWEMSNRMSKLDKADDNSL